METSKNYGWMKWAILVLAVLNLTTIGTILYHHYGEKNLPVVETMKGKRGGQQGEHFSGRFFKEKLMLDDQQLELFRPITREFRQNARNCSENLHRNRKAFHDALIAEPADTVLLKQISDSIGFYHSALKQLSYQYYFNLKGICTAEQQIRLNELFETMFIQEPQRQMQGGAGPGCRNRWKDKASDRNQQ